VGGRGLCLGAEKTEARKLLDTKRGNREASHLPKRSEGMHAFLLMQYED
jgi:hypothetical protein